MVNMAQDDLQDGPRTRQFGHWSRTRLLAFVTIVFSGFFVLVMPLALVGFREFRPFGFPPHYFYAAEGALFLLVILVFWFTGRQQLVDRDFAMAEEE